MSAGTATSPTGADADAAHGAALRAALDGRARAAFATDRRAARTAGVLLSVVSYLGIGLGTAVLAAVRDPLRDVATIAADRTLVLGGVALELVNVAAIVGFAVVLFPYVRRAGEALARGYVAMRVLEGAAYVVAAVSTVSLVSLGDDVVHGADAAAYGPLQAAVLAQTEAAGTVAAIPFVFGAIALYALLYRSRLVPRWISVWGWVAVALLVVANVAAPDPGDLSPASALVLPMIANELWLAGWLILKGFARTSDPSVVPGLPDGPSHESETIR